MRIAIFALGSRGDVEPVLALAHALTKRGHDAVVGVTVDLIPFGLSLGVDVRPLSVDAREFLQSEEGRHWLASGNSKQFLKRLIEKRREVAGAIHDDMINMVRGADLVMSSFMLEGEAASLAEWLGVPFTTLHIFPTRSNAAFAAPLVTTRHMPATLNRLTHSLFTRSEWKAIGWGINMLRTKVGLGPIGEPTPTRLARTRTLEIQAYSSFVLPELARWNSNRPLVGYLRLAADQRAMLTDEIPDPALQQWLDQGDAPVYFGFGSMPVEDVPSTLQLIRDTCATLGLRGLISAGWSDLPPEAGDERLHFVNAVNHDEILERCRVVVHHGGAGTTAAAMYAGTPSVVCSVFADQPFWGATVERLGIGKTFPFVKLSRQKLISSIEPLLSERPRRRARQLANELHTEDAATYSAELLEGML